MPTKYRLNWAEVDDPFPSWNSLDGGNLWYSGTEIDFSGVVDPGVTYKLWMRAIYRTGPNAPWSGPWSEVVEERVKDALPAEPTGLRAAPTAQGAVTLNWTDPEDNAVTGYRILRGASAETLTTLIEDSGNTAASYSDSTAAADTTYYYAVAAPQFGRARSELRGCLRDHSAAHAGDSGY